MEKAREVCRQRMRPKATPQYPKQSRSEIEIHSSSPAKSTRALSPELGTEPDAVDCIVAGSNCRLRDVNIMLTPRVIKESVKIKSLLREHGIQDYYTDHVQLVAKGNEDFFSRMLCLVVTNSYEDRAALKKIKLERDGDNEATKFIEVYDWKVLNAIADLEAVESVGSERRKDPWQRWRVGLI
jgi:hypothetical protein